MKGNEIMVVHGHEYEQMTYELLTAANLAGEIPGKDARIGIKPNLVAPVPASEGATTHPEIIRGLIRYLRDHGFENLIILESSWVGDSTEDSLVVCGYHTLLEETGVPFVDIKKSEPVLVDCAGMELLVGKVATELDFLINVPVMKGHCQTRMTCALKNLKGLLPDKEKRSFHRRGLHEPIGHLSAGIHQDFILVDQICSDLSFEDGGNPVEQNRIFACKDPVLCDTYCCSLMGIPVEEVPYIQIAMECGCGSNDLDQATITYLNAEAKDAQLTGLNKAMCVKAYAQEVESCSACYGSLVPALYRLKQEGILPEMVEEQICIGQGYQKMTGKLGIGNCTHKFEHSLAGCPPKEEEIYEFLKGYYLSVQ